MKITEIETFVVDAGWRPWQFVAVRTDEGVTGYGEMSDGRNPYGIVGTINDMEPILIGSDPLAVEARYWDMYRLARQSPGGIAAKAIAGVELALWDIKGKALGGAGLLAVWRADARATDDLLVALRQLAGSELRPDPLGQRRRVGRGRATAADDG